MGGIVILKNKYLCHGFNSALTGKHDQSIIWKYQSASVADKLKQPQKALQQTIKEKE